MIYGSDWPDSNTPFGLFCWCTCTPARIDNHLSVCRFNGPYPGFVRAGNHRRAGDDFDFLTGFQGVFPHSIRDHARYRGKFAYPLPRFTICALHVPDQRDVRILTPAAPRRFGMSFLQRVATLCCKGGGTPRQLRPLSPPEKPEPGRSLPARQATPFGLDRPRPVRLRED